MNGRKTILVVDDIEINRDILKVMLEDKYNIEEACNSLEARTILERRGGIVSLILLDIVMPVADGFELLRWMQTREELAHIPVAFVTAEATEQNLFEGVRMGVRDVILKPLDWDVVTDKVDRLIALAENHAQEPSADGNSLCT